MLLVNGCSYTYGDELENPERDRWSTHFGRRRNKEVVNIARPGSSNSKIFKDTMDYLRWNKVKHCIVMWSAFERVEVYDLKKEDWLQVSPSRLDDGEKYITKNKKYWEYYYALITNRETCLLNTLNHMVQLQWICEELDIELLQGWFHENCWKEYKRLVELATKKSHPVKKEIEILFKQLNNNSKFGMGDKDVDDFYTLSFNEFTDNNDDDLLDGMFSCGRMPLGHPDARAHEFFSIYLNDICKTRGLF